MRIAWPMRAKVLGFSSTVFGLPIHFDGRLGGSGLRGTAGGGDEIGLAVGFPVGIAAGRASCQFAKGGEIGLAGTGFERAMVFRRPRRRRRSGATDRGASARGTGASAP